jgi:hypothetical protein
MAGTPMAGIPKSGGQRPGTGKTAQDLLLSVQSVVKNRGGSVLARQLILKSDHFDTAVNTRLDFSLFGAPNFRMADLNVFGVAQPTISGISTILHLLQCSATAASSARHTVYWFSAREEPLVYINQKPFVLREAANPFENLKTYHGISAERLESMEARLKEDVIREILKWNQLLLVHEEIEDGRVIPTWTSVDSIQTPKEVFATLAQRGYAVKYVRIPISPEQAPEDHYLDDYVETIKASSPEDPLVFNCGMGVGRTTFAMVVAMILRRAQILHSGLPDPFNISSLSSSSRGNAGAGSSSSSDSRSSDSKTTLRLVYMLEQGLSSKASPRSAIDWALARGPLIEDLRNAIQGNYQCILQLLGLLSQGSLTKRILDEIIDRCTLCALACVFYLF